MELLDLLQDRVGLTTGVHIPRQQQQRDTVGGGRRGSGQHVGRAGAHRGGAGVDLSPPVLLGKTDGGVGHALFVAPLMHQQAAAVLFQRLPEPQHIAVAKNREHPGHKFALDPVHLDVLVIEKLHQRLGHGQSCRRHVCTLELAQPLRQPQGCDR